MAGFTITITITIQHDLHTMLEGKDTDDNNGKDETIALIIIR